MPWHTYRWQGQRLTRDSPGEIRAFFDAEVWMRISPIVDTVAACHQRLYDRATRWIASCTMTTGFAAQGRLAPLPRGKTIMALASILNAVAQAAAIGDIKPWHGRT